MNALDNYRKEIDEIDAQITRLFLRRMGVTEKVGEYKRSHGIPILDSGRERELLSRKAGATEDPARKADVTALFEAILGISRRQQRRLLSEEGHDGAYRRIRAALDHSRAPLEIPRVLYQGEPGAYADEAAVLFFGEEVPRNRVDAWEEIFLTLRDGRADYGVLPIENSSTGSISQVYDLLAKYGAYIVGEQTVKVDHCLAALPGTGLEDIREVCSHEQGLLQCAALLKEHPDWKPVARLNTAESAKFVAESGDRSRAAICSHRAAELYGLTILAEQINSNSRNYTRFVVVSPVVELREGSNKVSALFVLPHRSGSLHELMTVFAVNGLNLLKLESRPIVGHSWEYLFFADFSGSLTAQGMNGVLLELSRMSEGLRILGNYPASEEPK